MTLPDRGPFTFPAPYDTTGIRITNARDTNGADALWYCGMSYWANINAHQDSESLYVFLSVDRQRGGDGPSLWNVNKANDHVIPLGAIFPPDHPLSWSTGEGWYWSATEPHILYASDPTHLYRVDVSPLLAGTGTVAIDPVVTCTLPGKILWQWHTSRDGRVHSATVKDAATYQAQGSAVFVDGATLLHQARGQYDECQIDQSGQWLLVKENVDVDGKSGEDNLIYHVDSVDGERILYDEEGAAGHSDSGFLYMVAADNWNSKPSAFRVWMFDQTLEPQGRLVYYTSDWTAQLGHVSHCNAVNALPDSQYVLGSTASRIQAPRNNEIIAFKLDGQCEVCVIAPVMTDLDAPGGGSDDYAKLPKANIDVTGTYCLYTGNNGTDRLDAFLVKIPTQLLVPQPPAPSGIWLVTDPSGRTRRFQEVP